MRIHPLFRVLTLAVLAMNLLFASSASAVIFDGAVDPANLGKGDHIYILANETNQLEGTVSSVTNLQSLMNYEASLGMKWIAVKASTGAAKYPSESNPQFTYQVVLAGHKAGLQVFGYNRSDGTDPQGEIDIARYVFEQGADGLIMDAEAEWETSHVPSLGTTAQIATLATNILKGIKDLYPTKFMAHAPFPVISLHSTFPYKVFGQYCDAVMPQAYWVDFGITPQSMVTNWVVSGVHRELEAQWKNWQNGLDSNYSPIAIKPIVPIGYAAVTTQPAADITTFVTTLTNLASPATSGGYKGVSWWRTGLRSSSMLTAIQNANIGGPFSAKPSLPSIPTGLTATSPGGCYVNLSWSSASNANNYILSRSSSNGGPYTDFASTLSTSYTDTNNVNSTTSYYYVIRSVNVSGESTNSAQASVTTPVPLLPSVASGLTAVNSGCQVNLSWTAGANATGYIIARGTSSGGPYTDIDSTNTTSYADTSGAEATTYYYVVRSMNLCGQSSNSSQASATTAAGCVSDILMDNVDAVFVGAWSTNNSTGRYLDDYRTCTTVFTTANKTATYTPNIATTGYYDVYEWHSPGANRPNDASHQISYNGGSVTVLVNQEINGGGWNLIASAKPFLAGTSGFVRISNVSAETSQAVMADGIRFAWSSKNQRISFPAIADKTYGNPAFGLHATASSGLAVTYTVISGPGTLSGTNLNITGAGTITIQADQAGDANYFAAPSVTQTVEVAKALATLSLSNLTQTYNGSARTITATTSPAGLTTDLVYDGSSNAPTNTGSYPVLATINETNYEGSAVGTLVINKATAPVTIGNLSQSYNGSARSVTTSTTPGGLSVSVTYNGSAIAPTNVGSYTIVATINEANYQGGATNTLVVSKGVATVTLGNLSQTYNGSARSASVSTTPAGLNVDVTYNGLAGAPTNAGSYTVIATVNEANYQGGATNTLVVSKSAATVTLGSLNQTYNGNARLVTTTTAPGGLNVDVTYNGSAIVPTNAGSYTVIGTINEVNYQGGATNTLVVSKSDATVSLEDLSRTYDGTAQSVGATIAPAGLTVNVTYNGSAIVPTNAGSYTVVGTINEPNYQGGATNTLVISKAVGTVSLGNLNQIYNGSAKTVTTTTSPSGLTVLLTYNGSASAPTNVGTYTVIGTINDINYQGSSTNTLTVGDGVATVTLGNLSQTYDGSMRVVTAATSPSGLAVNITYNGSTNAPTNAGSYTVVGTVVDVGYHGSATNTLVVSKSTASVALGSLTQTYNGAARPVTVSTVPSGLALDLYYDGSGDAPTNAGSYAITATINELNYQGGATNTLVIGKSPATISLGNLSQSYNGTSRSVTVETTPSGLAFNVTYNGLTSAPSDPGNYPVVATINESNYFGATTNILSIGGPVITAQPTSVSVNLSNATSLTVAADGSGSLRYAWYFKAATALPAAPFAVQAGKTNATLSFTNALATQAGSYYAVVTNAYGKATSSVATVTVIVPPKIAAQPTVSPKATVPNGSLVYFSVPAISGSAPSYQWYLNGNPIASATASKYTNYNATFSDSGIYTVIASNAAGSATNANTLVLTVVQDTNIPAVAITKPLSLSITSSTNNPTGTVLAYGTAADNARVTNVYYRLNGSAWSPVATFVPTVDGKLAKWTNEITAVAGTNALEAYSVDYSGTNSKIAKVVFYYHVPSPITVSIDEHDTRAGEGTDSLWPPDYRATVVAALVSLPDNAPTNGANLYVNRGPYKLTAIAGHNQMFTNWTVVENGVTNFFSTNAAISFVMTTNMHLVANFVHNPWMEAAGEYTGLFTDPGMSFESSGFISLLVGTNRSFSGKLLIDGDNLALAGSFNVDGTRNLTVSRALKGKTNLFVGLKALFGADINSGTSSGTNQVIGSVTNGAVVSTIRADQWIYKGASTNPYYGKYTMILPKGEDAATSPGGYGYGLISVATNAKPTVLGAMADSTIFTPEVAAMSLDGKWPVFKQIYLTSQLRTVNFTNEQQFHTNLSYLGTYIGWLQFTNNSAIGGELKWTKTLKIETNLVTLPVGVYTNYYTNGFTNTMEVTAMGYTTRSNSAPAGADMRVILVTNALLSFTDGNLTNTQNQAIHLNTNNTTKFITNFNVLTQTNQLGIKGTNAQLGALSVTFLSTSGKMSGAFTNTMSQTAAGSAKPLLWSGAVLQPLNIGYGYFLGTNRSGAVVLQQDPGNYAP